MSTLGFCAPCVCCSALDPPADDDRRPRAHGVRHARARRARPPIGELDARVAPQARTGAREREDARDGVPVSILTAFSVRSVIVPSQLPSGHRSAPRGSCGRPRAGAPGELGDVGCGRAGLPGLDRDTRGGLCASGRLVVGGGGSGRRLTSSCSSPPAGGVDSERLVAAVAGAVYAGRAHAKVIGAPRQAGHRRRNRHRHSTATRRGRARSARSV